MFISKVGYSGNGRLLAVKRKNETAGAVVITGNIDTMNGAELLSNLKKCNIKLADNPGQENEVLGWLNNEYSGYPAIARAILKFMNGRAKMAGEAVPLTIIGGKVKEVTGYAPYELYSKQMELEDSDVANILFKAWKVKNSGIDFNSIDEVAPKKSAQNDHDTITA